MATAADSKRETCTPIDSDKVDGTTAFGTDDRKIDSVQRVMIHKICGFAQRITPSKVSSAVSDSKEIGP
jgi:hypothetical protein